MIMEPTVLVSLSLCIFVIAILYSMVGHGGASGYIAVMALFSLGPVVMRPTALMLNIIVSFVAFVSFARAGHFSWRLFWPFAVLSAPCSFIGGYLGLPPHLFKPMVAIILLFASIRLLLKTKNTEAGGTSPPLPASLAIGAGLGFLSGLTGVGGGIFLSPLLLLLGWGRVREVSAVAALFILINSMAGLFGHASASQPFPSIAPLLAFAALGGGIIGSLLGSRRLPVRNVTQALSAVLAMAVVKLLLI
jgi:uncharacterized membrane protein YfcA